MVAETELKQLRAFSMSSERSIEMKMDRSSIEPPTRCSAGESETSRFEKLRSQSICGHMDKDRYKLPRQAAQIRRFWRAQSAAGAEQFRAFRCHVAHRQEIHTGRQSV